VCASVSVSACGGRECVPGRGFGRWRRAAASGCGGGLRLRAVAAGCGFGLCRRVAAVGRGFGRWRRAAGCGGGLWLWASAPKLHGRLVAIRWSHLGREVHPALLRSDTADDKTRRDGHARKCPLVAPDPPATCQPRDGRALLFDDSAVPLLAWSRAAAEGRWTLPPRPPAGPTFAAHFCTHTKGEHDAVVDNMPITIEWGICGAEAQGFLGLLRRGREQGASVGRSPCECGHAPVRCPLDGLPPWQRVPSSPPSAWTPRARSRGSG
jgi:hypothetical protein